MRLPTKRRRAARSRGSTSVLPAPRASAAPAGSPPTSCIPETRSTPPGPRSSGTPSDRRGPRAARNDLDGDPLERLRVLVAALLAHIAVALAHELLDIPLAARLGKLALVLTQRLDLPVERRRDVDEVVPLGPERDPAPLHLVRLEALFEQ